ASVRLPGWARGCAPATLEHIERRSHVSIGRWSIHHPRVAVAAWIAFVVACVALGAISGTKTLDNGAVGESARGYAIMDKHSLWGPPRELAYLHSSQAPVAQSAIRDVERRFGRLG